jgi:DNA-binding CsgD family transcriptional regulator
VQARVRGAGPDADRPAAPSRLRVRAPSGQWLLLDAAECRDATTSPRWIAVAIRPALPGDLLSLVALRYGLSPREQAVVRLVMQGWSTDQIAATLQISPLTVQDHLKATFAKTDVSSRRELAFRLALPRG